ncbi:MAG: RNA polymerase sigma factor [Polyangiales bacterium]|nr:RNA polymerase sigma factor [Myxococcales bacterium]
MNTPVHSFETHLERGDLNAAAEWLVRTHGRDVLHLCTAIVRDRGTAEDLAQDAFSKAFTALPDFRGEASARTWLMTIARHRCLDHLRRSARQPWSLGREEDLREPAHASDDVALVSDLLARHADLRVGLDALDEGDRAMVLLRFVHGLSFEEIATSFGVKSGAVRMRVGRALSKMRDAIEGATSPEIPLDLRGSIVVGAAPVPRRTGAPAAPAASNRANSVLSATPIPTAGVPTMPTPPPAAVPAGPPPPSAPPPAYAGPPAGAAPPPAAMAPGPPAPAGARGGAQGRDRAEGAFARLRARVAQVFGGSESGAPLSAMPPASGATVDSGAASTSDALTRTRAGGADGDGTTLDRMLGALLSTLVGGQGDDAADDAFVQRLLGDVPDRGPSE